MRRKKCGGGLFSWEEDIIETQRRPANWARFLRDPDGFTLDSPAEPVEKLVFCSFDDYRITSDAEGIRDGTMRF